MNKAVEEGVEPPLAALLARKRGKKTKAKRGTKAAAAVAATSEDQNTEPERVEIESERVEIEPEPIRIEPERVQTDEESSEDGCARVKVSAFDDSVESHFRAMGAIAELCGEEKKDLGLEQSEIRSLSSSITFLREWADLTYEPRDVRFACGVGSPDRNDVVSGITLRQYSSATVPKVSGDTSSPELSRDFVMYVGGPVWALDWCPRVHQTPDHHPKCEFIAIAAHPPGSTYHKLGEPLTGRGAIQIWCLLNVGVNEADIQPIVEKPKRVQKNSGFGEEKSTEPKRPIGRPRKKPIEEKSTEPKRPRGRPRKEPIEESAGKEDTEENSTEPKRPRGRPRKEPIDESLDKEDTEEKSIQPKRRRRRPKKKLIEESVDNLDGTGNYVEAPVLNSPEESLDFHSTDCVPAQEDHGKKRKSHLASKISVPRRKLNNMESAGSNSKNTCSPLLDQNQEKGPVSDHHIQQTSGQDPQTSNNVQNSSYSKIGSTRCSVPKDLALPRIILSLAHHGKVAWDVKWRPLNEHDSKCKHRMGYLAVLSGNGSLEVWDVPLPGAVETIYSSSCGEGTDPRFVKIAPVFRCSMLKRGGENSIPLTVEWSTSPDHDYLLAGCHNGTVALWKFSASNASQDTRPLLCFSADTNPIRALAWAPVESSEGANVIATAGHGGLKFWDLRDPFRPLWDLDHLPRFIYSLEWLPNPRCVLLSFDDGTMKVISLVKTASDDPVTGNPLVGTKQPGLHNLSCLPFAIWSVHVSRLTGMAAYCGADGTILRFQLTSKSVEKDPRRNRAPHFLCVSLTMEESAVTINTPVPNTLFPMKAVRNISEPNKAKSANDKMAKDCTSEDQTLALCYGEDLESSDKVASLKSKKGQKSGSSKKKPEDDQALVCIDEETTHTQEELGAASVKSKKPQKPMSSKKKPSDDQQLVCMDEEPSNTREEESGKELEVFPDKLVAMHRVRWNMNKGSERWLCYGGAAGIVRCQEIVLSDIDKAWAMKK